MPKAFIQAGINRSQPSDVTLDHPRGQRFTVIAEYPVKLVLAARARMFVIIDLFHAFTFILIDYFLKATRLTFID